MGKKQKASDDEPIPVMDPAVELGRWHEFEPSLEHLRTTKAIIVVTLDRLTGEVEVDDKLSTPAETWYSLDRAATERAAVLDGTRPWDD